MTTKKTLGTLILLIAVLGLLSGCATSARSSLKCPGPCTKTCNFELQLNGSKDATACGGTGGFKNAELLTLKRSPAGEDCEADLDREPTAGKGYIKWKLCNGTDCELQEKNFPDKSPIPYDPNNLPAEGLPAGKVALSPACYASFTMSGTPKGGGGYKFPVVKSMSTDFDIITKCTCNGTDNTGSLGIKANL